METTTEWFVARDGQSFGPFAFIVLVDAARSGELRGDDFVWRAGMKTWARASTLTDLWTPLTQPTHVVTAAVTSAERTSTNTNDTSTHVSKRLPITLMRLLIPRGRTNRTSFWGLVLSMYGIGLAAIEVVYFLWPTAAERAWAVVVLLAVSVAISAVIGRLHDHDITGWYAILYAMPLTLIAGAQIEFDWQQALWRIGNTLAPISVLAMIIHIGAMRGTIGPNRFGPDPAVKEHPDDYFSRVRVINLLQPAWTPVLRVLGRTWVAFRWLMSKVGARRLAAAMKSIEEKYERGVQKNLELAERMHWHQVLRWYGRSVLDPRLRAPTFLSIIAEITVALYVVPAVTGLSMWGGWALLTIVVPEIGRSLPETILPTTVIVVFVFMAVIVAAGFLWLRLTKATPIETA